MQKEILEKDLNEEEKATIEWRQCFNTDNKVRSVIFIDVRACKVINVIPQIDSAVPGRRMFQFECDICAEEHYHTRRNVNTLH